MDEENLKEEIKGLSKDIREDLIQEANNRGYHITYNKDGSTDFREDKFINGMRILGQSWCLLSPIDLDIKNNEKSD